VIRACVPAETAYQKILGQYQQALDEKWDAATLLDAGLVSMTADLAGAECRLGYRIEDLDGNNTPELMIAVEGENEFLSKMVFALYTLDEAGNPLLLKESRERDRMYYAGGASFANLGSNGADDSFEGALLLQDGTLVPEETVIDPSEYVQPELTLFH